MVPGEAGRAVTHQIIYDELCAGVVTGRSREKLTALIEVAKAEGADAVILGCTELGLILDPDALPLPGFDSAVIHAEAAVDFALGA
jgi:aspartate racemase